MKIFSIIFAIYLLALSCTPCSDQDDCVYKDQETISTFTAADHGNHDNENCSPFCICACYGQSITTLYDFSATTDLFPVSKQVFPSYTSSFVSEVFFNIWQPPKIG